MVSYAKKTGAFTTFAIKKKHTAVYPSIHEYARFILYDWKYTFARLFGHCIQGPRDYLRCEQWNWQRIKKFNVPAVVPYLRSEIGFDKGNCLMGRKL